MKKFKFWALLTTLTGLSIVFTSCGKNDDEDLYTTPNEDGGTKYYKVAEYR